MDNDSAMIQVLGDALVDLFVKFRASTLQDQQELWPRINELQTKLAAYQVDLYKQGVISTDADLKEMEKIRDEINRAADHQALLAAIVHTICFAVTHMQA